MPIQYRAQYGDLTYQSTVARAVVARAYKWWVGEHAPVLTVHAPGHPPMPVPLRPGDPRGTTRDAWRVASPLRSPSHRRSKPVGRQPAPARYGSTHAIRLPGDVVAALDRCRGPLSRPAALAEAVEAWCRERG